MIFVIHICISVLIIYQKYKAVVLGDQLPPRLLITITIMIMIILIMMVIVMMRVGLNVGMLALWCSHCASLH